MKKEVTLTLLLCGAVLTVAAVTYGIIHYKNKDTTTCKAPNKGNTMAKNNNTTEANSPSKASPSNNPNSGNSKDNLIKTTVVNKVGNTNGNILNRGLATQQDKWVYFNCNGLCKAMLDMKTGWQRLNYDNAENINVIGEWIYYTERDMLHKIKIDGSNKTKLLDDKVSNVIANTQWLFYINVQDNNLYKIDVNGKNVTKLSSELCSNFSLVDDWIYLDARANDYSEYEFYKIHLDGSNKTTLPQTAKNFLFILDNNFIFINHSNYNNDKSTSSNLLKTDLNGNNAINLCSLNSSWIRSYNILKNYLFFITFDTNGSKLYKLNSESKTQEQPSLIYTLNGDQSSMTPYIASVDNFFLLYCHDFHGLIIYKIDENGKIEKLTK